MNFKSRAWVSAVVSVLAASLLCASLALAATPPTAATSPATNVTTSSATLNGAVTPNKTTTSYHFEYGQSTSLGSTTAPGTVSGNASKSVSTDVTGLIPGTKYYFRIVASSASGTATGSEMSFTTSLVAVPPSQNSVSISSVPPTIISGRTAQITGQVTGPDKANSTVVLESSPYPYTGAFTPTGQTTTTSTAGTYAFTVQPGRNTHYQVTVATKVPVTSSVTTVSVRVKVIIHVSTLRPFRGQLVRFFGTVTPAHNGRYAQIQRRTATGAWRTVASAKLVDGGLVNGTAVSRYSRKLRIQFSGTYRVRVNPRDGDHLIGTSGTRYERVR